MLKRMIWGGVVRKGTVFDVYIDEKNPPKSPFLALLHKAVLKSRSGGLSANLIAVLDA